MGVIRQLKQFLTGTQIFPVTKTKAVYDDTLGRLDEMMKGYLTETDGVNIVTNTEPRDADRFGGQLPEYYAKNSELEEAIENVESSILEVDTKVSSIAIFVDTSSIVTTITAKSSSWTATEDCWCAGWCGYGSGAGIVYLDGCLMSQQTANGTSGVGFPVKAGQIVKTGTTGSYAITIYKLLQ